MSDLTKETGNTVMFNGEYYPVTFGGLDRDTYKHSDGCLWLKNNDSPCICGAAERASRVYYFKVPPK